MIFNYIKNLKRMMICIKLDNQMFRKVHPLWFCHVDFEIAYSFDVITAPPVVTGYLLTLSICTIDRGP